VNINWETVLVALIQAVAAVVTTCIQQRCRHRGGRQKKRAQRPASHT
jgi:hypothetical protein